MYYHVRLDRIFHDGCTDMDAQAGWDFRSLTKALAMIGRDYGKDAAGWRIQDLTEPMSNIMLLENYMRVALESSHQFVVMTFKDASTALKKYDHYEFFVVAREEAERFPEFAFSKEDEEAIHSVLASVLGGRRMWFHPSDSTRQRLHKDTQGHRII